MRVLLTGSYGRVGTAIIEHLSVDDSFDFTYLDVNDHPEYETVIADIANYEAIRPAFENQDAVVHLAATTETSAPWEAVLENNIVGVYNVFRAAQVSGVEQVVFASSNSVLGLYEERYAPDIYYGEVDFTLNAETPARPDSLYGTSKVFGEALGRYYAETDGFPTRCYALRIGSVRDPEYDHPYGDAERGVEEGRWNRNSEAYNRKVARMKATWQSRRDAAQLVDRCLRDKTVTFDVFYGVSDNMNRWFDIEHARDIVGYDPVDSADEWERPPS